MEGVHSAESLQDGLEVRHRDPLCHKAAEHAGQDAKGRGIGHGVSHRA